jgi:YD repeat-containing protein
MGKFYAYLGVGPMSGATPIATYQYDGDGHRIAKTTSSGTTNYIYDAFGRLAAEYINGNLSKDYGLWLKFGGDLRQWRDCLVTTWRGVTADSLSRTFDA